MSAMHNDLARAVQKTIWMAGFLGINLIPGMAMAGTLTGGATLPEQVVQEVTALQSYAKNVTTALSSVQNEINTLNSYMTQLQNLTTLPARELGKITTPIQQMEYNYQEIMGLKDEYQDLYGNLSDIQRTVEQQNLDILNSDLSPEDYLNTVETANTRIAKQSKLQIQQAANSMIASDKLVPEIEAQSKTDGSIASNIGGQEAVAKELNTVEQQNEILLQDIASAQMAKNKRLETHEMESEVVNNPVAMAALYKSNADAQKDLQTATSQASSAWKSYGKSVNTFNSCIDNGGTYLSCACQGNQSDTTDCQQN